MDVLSPGLYGLLEHAFGCVRVSKAGQQAVLGPGVDARTNTVRTRSLDFGESYLVLCPFCGDSSGHLAINYRYGAPAPDTGRPDYGLAKCWRRDCLSDPTNRQLLRDMVFTTSRPQPLRRPPVRRSVAAAGGRLVPVGPPGALIPVDQLDNGHRAAAYLDGRFFDRKELSAVWSVSYCTEPCTYTAMVGRIFVPFFLDGAMVGWQGRWPADLDWKAAGITKYYNLPGLKKTELLYNIDQAVRSNGPVVLVEGVTDVWSIGPQGLGLLGKTLHLAQLNLIVSRLAGRPLLVMLDSPDRDPDTALATTKVIAQLRGRVDRIVRVDLCSGLDPGECPRAELWQYLRAVAASTGIEFSIPDVQTSNA